MKLVIAEKPSVAREIASVIGAKNRCEGGFSGNGYLVTAAFGHLVGLADPDVYREEWKQWSLATLPMLPDSMKLAPTGDEGALARLRLLRDLIGKAEEVIAATDAGREGELIFRNIWRLCRGQCRVSRLWISSLTNEAIRQGMSSLRPLSEFDNLAAAAAARAEADWLVGMNASRAYTVAFSSHGVLSMGRVQTPVLALIVARDLAIEAFRVTPFWELVAEYRGGLFKRSAGRFDDQEKAQSMMELLRGNDLVISEVRETEKREKAPALYDLTELQRDGNKIRKLEAKRTLEIAQALYERQTITYPRTDSRFLSSDMVATATAAMEVAKAVIGDFPTGEISGNHRCFNDAKVSDHHGIIPTTMRPSNFESEDEKWVYEAICRRLVAAFAGDCRKAVTEIAAMIGDEAFKATGTLLLDAGWRELYQSAGSDEEKEPETTLPKYAEGERGECALDLVSGKTTPPKAFTEATLLTAMEQAGKEVDDEELREAMKERGLGTPATRAGIIETLVGRKYIVKEKGKILATVRGRALIAAIADPILKSPELTGEWEHKLKLIERGQLNAPVFLIEVRTLVRGIVEAVRTAGENQALTSATERGSLGNCPVCKKPVHEIPKSWACSDRSCSFVIWKTMCSKSIPESAARALLEKGRTAVLKGFVARSGKKFDASLFWNLQEQRVGLDFAARDDKKKSSSKGKNNS